MKRRVSVARCAARVRAVQESFIPSLHLLLRETPGALSLGQGVVFYPPPASALAALRDASGGDFHRYGDTFGAPELLRALGDKLCAENGVASLSGRCLLVTAGGNMAFLSALLAITDPGDEVILPLPYYFNHAMAAELLGCRVVTVATGADWQLDPDVLKLAVTPRTRALVTVSPNNPSGVVYTPDRLSAINRLCVERGIYHISDEAYEYFCYGSTRHYSPACGASSANWTISLFSFSKAYGMAGWRLGYLLAPEHLGAALAKIQDTNLICPPLPLQQAALGALQAGPAYCGKHLPRLAKTRSVILEEFAREEGLPCSLAPGDGAFYLLLQVHTSLDDRELATRLLREHRVAVLPGSCFGLRQGCYLRIAYGALTTATAVRATRRLLRGLRALLLPTGATRRVRGSGLLVE